MKFNTNPVRGTVDYLPNEMEIRTYAERIILETYKENGFMQVKTPILENLDLLTNGDSGDNQKLMFKTIKRGAQLDLTKENLTEKDIVEEGLRYDLTVPLVRIFSNNKEKLPYPFKAIQIDEAFRAERPQKGRVRQFTQCDIDILGEATAIGEIELLIAGAKSYKRLGFDKLTIKVNDRRVLNELIVKSGFNSEDTISVCISLDKFDKIGTDGVAKELENNGYNSENVEKLMNIFEQLKMAKSNTESFEVLEKIGVSSEVVSSLRQIIETVTKYIDENYNVVYDSAIIRGQGYYTGTVFEVYDDDFGRAIGGGGRYDKMVEKFLNTPVPAVGFSIGFYSVVMLMMEKQTVVSDKKLALIYDKKASYDEIISAKESLISRGYYVSTFVFPKNFNNFAEKLKTNGYNKIVKMQNLDKIINL
ncbi:MAG: ATP phosphoribosyltransferase regulatory subunit [Clostridia bacterium]|nr:ATP phosphoribosyltransferase regulatory subunit [Clostridia bacterium]